MKENDYIKLNIDSECRLTVDHDVSHQHYVIQKLAKYDIQVYDRNTAPVCRDFQVIFLYHSVISFKRLKDQLEIISTNRESDVKFGSTRSLQGDIFAVNEIYKEYKNIPIVHITETDVFDEDEQLHYVPRFKKFLDSSIWHYYIPIYKFDKKNNKWHYKEFNASLKQKIQEIIRNYKLGLYRLNITREYVELNKRLLSNSFLIKKTHGQYVAPFIFHSESEFKRTLDAEQIRRCKYTTKKWRILLVDDCSNLCLSEDDQTERNRKGDVDDMTQAHKLAETGKLRIIIEDILLTSKLDIAWCCPSARELKDIAAFNDYNTRVNKDNRTLHHTISLRWNYINENSHDFKISIVCAKSIHDALILIKYLKFDLILLDYLLGDHPKEARREYSYELLKEIERNLSLNEQSYWIGPQNRFYFMHISAFVPAISERLQEQGLIRDTPYWHIARGACPTNTPYLFLYYLYRLMEKRYNEMSLGKESGMSGHTLVDFLNNIFDDDFKKVKYKASKHFNTLLNLRNKYDIMKHDVYDEDSNLDWLHKRGSLLVYSLFPDIKCYSNAFWEHMQQLIYLVAFGTVRQWPEMWEEYVFVRDRLKEAEQKVQTVNNCPFRKVRFLSDKIEDYIIQLRNR